MSGRMLLYTQFLLTLLIKLLYNENYYKIHPCYIINSIYFL